MSQPTNEIETPDEPDRERPCPCCGDEYPEISLDTDPEGREWLIFIHPDGSDCRLRLRDPDGRDRDDAGELQEASGDGFAPAIDHADGRGGSP